MIDMRKRCLLAILFLIVTFGTTSAEEPAQFFRGLNLNGEPVTIDGHMWEGRDASWYQSDDRAFENQNVQLVPTTDEMRAKMIRSSRWGGNRIVLTDIPDGTYTVFLYVWEDNNSETYSVRLNDRVVADRVESGNAGQWQKLGPWIVQPVSGRIILTSQGGAANFSGIEIWQGEHDGMERPISEEDLAFFEKRIRPLLIERCYECHSQESKELHGELLVDSRATIRRGGTLGAAVVPGDPANSLLMTAVKGTDSSLLMPPDEKLSEEEIRDLEHWIKMGAPDPRSRATRHTGKQIDIAKAREFWSLRPLVKPEVPSVRNTEWVSNEIDSFVLAKMEAEGIAPSDTADRATLLRRVTFDLIGLPPTVDELNAFLSDTSPEAFAKAVDRLLESPRYGERWGRHWLDVVRYADTAGDNSDYPIPQMHRYRDWVIDAFNRDLPWDDFVRDQLAGDLRGGETWQEREQRIIATGYIANARRFGSRVDDYPQHLTIEDTLDNLGRSFLGLSLSCARCHDHKFDPVTTRDYYALYGIFQNTRYPWPGIELEKRQRDLVPLLPDADRESAMNAMAEWKARRKALEDDVEKRKKQNEQTKDAVSEKALSEAQAKLKQHDESKPVIPLAYAVSETGQYQDAAIQLKGNPNQTGDVVARRFLTVLGGTPVPESVKESGRRQLAEWILSDENPLTDRVIVNRIWLHHFGKGIVSSPNDFGHQGRQPSHPELLDFLAVKFRETGGSFKAMHKLILMSRTWQQSAVRTASAVEKDPANETLSGYPIRRMDAETIRDTLLFLGGDLNLDRPGPHPFPDESTWDFTQHHPFKAIYEHKHRSVFLMTQRIQRHPWLAVFDGADPSTSVGTRLTTTTPLQALFLMNDELVHRQAESLAARLRREVPDTQKRIQRAWLMLFAREPEPDEAQAAKQFLDDARSLVSDADTEQQTWSALVRSWYRLNEFVYIH
jgi:hypothetical protein